MSETHRIGSDGLSAAVSAAGAELTSLRGADGAELLWQAGPEWPRHAPVLFPIVGRLADDTLHAGGRKYTLAQHGLARDATFAFAERTPDRAVLVLEDSDATRAHYPYPFRLEQRYAVEGSCLSVTSRVTNPGGAVLPCGIGAHPAFRWPLAEGVPKHRHALLFEREERGPVLSVEGGLLGSPKPVSPIRGNRLDLDEAVFAKDALVLPDVASRAVRFAALDEGGRERRAIRVSWEGYKDLGVWSKPAGAAFLCIEPWFSMASPVGWDGPFEAKPGILHLAPGETRDFTWTVDVMPA